MKKRIALLLIKWLSQWTYSKVTHKDRKLMMAPVMDSDGTPLVLEYMGEKHQMYKYKNEADMTIGRAIWSKFFEEEKGMNISRKFLSESLGRSLEDFNGNDHAKAAFNMIMLKDLVDNHTPMDVLLNQAAVLYFDEEEDHRVYDADRHNAKVDAMRKYPDQGFFLKMLLLGMGISGDQSLEDMQSYLQESERKMQRYQKTISGMAGSRRTKSGAD